MEKINQDPTYNAEYFEEGGRVFIEITTPERLLCAVAAMSVCSTTPVTLLSIDAQGRVRKTKIVQQGPTDNTPDYLP